jgi:hypothetical protein
VNELWVARDVVNGLRQFDARPIWNEDGLQFLVSSRGSWAILMHGDWFTDLLPGQCRRLVMKSEASE